MLKVWADDTGLMRNLRQLADKDIKRAASWALNDAADDVLKDVQSRMDRVFDRPTRFTKNAFMIRKAGPNRLEAVVTERPSVGRRHYLKVQELGGPRGQTGLEGLLSSQVDYDGTLQSAMPANGARLDANGNWARGERTQVIAAVQGQGAAPDAGSGETRQRKRKRAGFFVPKASSRLTPGIWKRAPDGSIAKILHFTPMAPVYDKRLGFLDGAQGVWDRNLPQHLRRTIARMVDRAASRSG